MSQPVVSLTDPGLTQPWPNPDGSPATTYVNPPYGRGIRKWLEKAICSAQGGGTVVMLVPARTDSVWFQQLMGAPSMNATTATCQQHQSGFASPTFSSRTAKTTWIKRGTSRPSSDLDH